MENTRRIVSLDVFRGATMVFLSVQILQLPQGQRYFPDSALWSFIGFNSSHVTWTGMSAWDLIQPAFMFIVGVALPWSIANRRQAGDTLPGLWIHTVWRSALLIFLGIFLRSLSQPATNFTFIDVLTQIGLGFPILFALAWTNVRTQLTVAIAILVAYWLAFALYPLAQPGFDYASVGIPPEWSHHLTGFAAHWDKNTNLAVVFDQWFLNLFPREQSFVFHPGGYTTLNFIPSLATMIFGLICGELLRSAPTPQHALRKLVLVGLATLVVGLVLDLSGLCPLVKRIWTPSWTLYSAGWVCLALAATYWLIEIRAQSRWFELFRIVGLNSLIMYMLIHLWDTFLIGAIKTHLGWNLLSILPHSIAEFSARVGAVILILAFCIWLHRKKIYIRL
jgi:heparan-alpha-glucosaminide N-acetyltransferase